MTSEPTLGASAKRRRRRRRRAGGGDNHTPSPALAPRRPAVDEDETGTAFPEARSSAIDYDRVAADCLEARHLEIFHWMKKALGKSSETLMKEIVRGAVVKERSAFREAQGIVSQSSRDLEKLTNR